MERFFCVLAWTHLNIYQDGSCRICCTSEWSIHNLAAKDFGNGMKPLNLFHDSIESVMNSDTFNKIRLDMLNGKVPACCIRCYQQEQRNIFSYRLIMNKLTHYTISDAISDTNGDGSVRNSLRSAYLRFGIFCNLKCRVCGPHNSKRWTDEYNNLTKELPFITNVPVMPERALFDDPEQWERLFNASTDFEFFTLIGGECMFSKAHWDFLRFIIKRKLAKKIKLQYNINMTFVPEYAYEIWSEFKSVTLGMSIDGIGKRFEYLRHGAQWNKVLSLLEELKKQEIILEASPTLTWMNVYYLKEYFSFLETFNIDRSDFIFVYFPSFLSPWILPWEIKEEIILKARSFLPENVSLSLKKQLLTNPSSKHLLKKGIQYHKWLDKSRNESFEYTFPELSNRLRECGF